MIALTDQQVQALEANGAGPPRVVNPRTHEAFVLVPVAEYERLTEDDDDYGEWTDEDRTALYWEALRAEGGGDDDWPEYNQPEPE